MECSRIRENEVVLIRREKVYKAQRLFQGKKVQFDKLWFYPDSALGCCYGSQFEIHGHQLVLVRENEASGRGEGGEECGVDNRMMVDDGSAQALRESDILRLRAEASGKEVVGSIVEHSTSFKEKTKYSQEKYITKKRKKHAPVITIIRPSTTALCHMYFARGPSKICHMRVDTVAQILTYSNVRAHSNMVVVETTQGLLLTAMLERMGGLGKLVQLFFGDFPVKLAVDSSSHLSPQDKAVLLEYPLHRVGRSLPPSLQSSVLAGITAPPLDTGREGGGGGDEGEGGEGGEEGEGGGEGDGGEGSSHDDPASADESETATELPPAKRVKEREKRRQQREERYLAAEEVLRQRRMDGLVVASRFHPEPLLTALLELLAPSRPVVVYCHLLEPLVECYKTLREREDLVFDVQIRETWTRNYQVLPERTHPCMTMDGQGGYLLTAMTLKRTPLPPPPPPAPAAAN